MAVPATELPASSLPQKHPLQRFPSPAIYGLSPLLHFLQLSAHLASFQYLNTADNPISSSFGWHFQYLTIFGLLFSTITAALGSAADLLSPFNNNAKTSTSPLSSASSILSSWQKSLLFGAAAPLELLIFCLYWSLRFIDKDLVVPPWAQMPLIPDLSFHLVPTVCLVIDALLLSPPPRFTPLQGLLIATSLALAYYPWVTLCHARNGYWPYTLFELAGPYGRVGLHVLSAVSMGANYSALRVGYAVLNGEGEKVRRKREEEEPEALRTLREKVGGQVRRRGEMVMGMEKAGRDG